MFDQLHALVAPTERNMCLWSDLNTSESLHERRSSTENGINHFSLRRWYREEVTLDDA